MLDEVDIIMGTFSKSLASVGGFIAAERAVVDYLKHTARPFVFSARLPAASVAAVAPALQTKVVEGQENPLSLIQIAKLYEVQKYISLTNHMWDGFWTLANAQAWNGLPKSLQEIVAKHVNAAAVQERADIAKLNGTVQTDLTGKGMQFNTTDAEKFRAALRAAGFYKDWKEKYGAQAWSVLEKQVGALG